MIEHIKKYIATRANPAYATADIAAAYFNDCVLRNGWSWWECGQDGFISYELKGDALVVYDIYIDPAVGRRSQDHWQEFLNEFEGRYNVIIGFSGFDGPNRHLGRSAMIRRGFVKAFETKDEEVFIHG